MTEFTPSLESRLYQFLTRDDYRPLKQHEIAAALGVSERRDLRHALRALEREGKIVQVRKNRWLPTPKDNSQCTGRLRVNAGRFGFVTPDEPGFDDLYISEEGLHTALDGDRVLVRISRSRAPDHRGTRSVAVGRPIGRIARVLERGRTSLVGLLCQTAWYWYVVPDNPRFIHSVRVREFESGHGTENHKVRIQLDEWHDAAQPLSGVVVEDLGPADAPGVDILSIIRDHSIDIDFPEEVLNESSQCPEVPASSSLAEREDLRGEMTLTVDPADAKDFDDAVSLEKCADGGYRLGVHIADVSHYVLPGSPTDREAFLRGNSVYLVDRTIPMLPPRLTTEVCSLHAGRDRLTHSVEVLFDAAGGVKTARTFSSVIRSRARLNYEQVQRVLDGAGDPDVPQPVGETLLAMRALASLLRRRRMDEGSIELVMPEIRCILNEDGIPVELQKRGASEAYHLIEEFMLAANRVVAGILAESETPAIYRIHPPPDNRQWGQMQLDLAALNIRTKSRTRESLNEIAGRTAGTPAGHVAHLAILRNMKRAMYSSTLSEHFGLAFSCYTHFTSPIRRYPDLVIHRMLASVERRAPSPVTHTDAARIAEHCSRMERNAADAEEESVNVKRIEYYGRLFEEKERGPFEAIIVSFIPKGLIIELTDTYQKGLVPFRLMGDDHYVLDRNGTEARGRRHRRTWRIGQLVKVMLARVDSGRQLVDFYPCETDRAGSSVKGRGKKTKPQARHRIR